MFIIDDDERPELPSRYGVDDIPLILQDKKFASGGASFGGDPLKGTFGILGDHILVNGTYDPFPRVRTERVRLRILNGVQRLDVPHRVRAVVPRSSGGDDDIDAGEFDLLKIVAAARLDESPAVPGRLAVEIWEIENNVYSHNFHIHEVAFRVLEMKGAPAYAGGHKDTVYVPPKSTVRLAVQFGRHTDPPTPYMYHCHLLRHEDSGMMGQFVIVEPGTEDGVSRTIPVAGHH